MNIDDDGYTDDYSRRHPEPSRPGPRGRPPGPRPGPRSGAGAGPRPGAGPTRGGSARPRPDAYQRDPWPPPDEGRRQIVTRVGTIAAGAVTVLAASVVGAVVIDRLGLMGDSDDEAAPVSAADGQAAAAGESTAASAPGTTLAPYLRLTLNGGELTLQGLVPDEASEASLVEAAEASFGTVANNLLVDAELGEAPWMADTPLIVSNLALLDGGTVAVSGERISVVGRAPSQQQATEFETAMTSASSLPIETSLEIAELQTAIVTVQATNSQATVTGTVPSQEVLDRIAEAMFTAYGQENVVVSGLVVDPGVSEASWMESAGDLVSALAQFEDCRIRLEGSALTGFVGGGAQFDPESADLTAEFQEILAFVNDVMTSDQQLNLLIEGHTDADGAPEYNQQLSDLRAEAVKTYLVEQGIDEARLTAEGRGENYPAAPNDTPEGRARNRRVELTLTVGSATS